MPASSAYRAADEKRSAEAKRKRLEEDAKAKVVIPTTPEPTVWVRPEPMGPETEAADIVVDQLPVSVEDFPRPPKKSRVWKEPL